MRVLAYGLMPNHWHLVLWPHHDGDLSDFMRWLTVTHTQRWHAQHHSAGTGPLYQGCFKFFSGANRRTFPDVVPLCRGQCAAGQLMPRAEHWRWSSMWHRVHHSEHGLLEPGR